MKVEFLKDHLGHKKGDTETVTAERANYFKRCQIAKWIQGKAIEPEKKQEPAKAPAQVQKEEKGAKDITTKEEKIQAKTK